MPESPPRRAAPASAPAPRLLFWADSFWPAIGGIEVWGASFVTSLRDRGYAVKVMTNHPAAGVPDRDVYQGVEVRRFPLWSVLKSQDPRRLLEVRRSIERYWTAFRPHCVHVNMCGPAILFYLLAQRAEPRPALLTLHGRWPDAYARPGSLLSRTMQSADWISCVSSATRQWVLDFHPRMAARSSVIRNAIPRPSAPFSVAPRDRSVVLCIGRLSEEKGFDLAIQAFARLGPSAAAARLVVAGDGPQRSTLEDLVRQLGLARAVRFLGWVPPSRVTQLLADCAICLIPSRSEGLPLVALEAARMGRPVVATDVGGIGEVVDDGRTGRLVASGVEPLARALGELLADRALVERLGRGAHLASRHGLGWGEHIDRYDALLRRISATGTR